MHSGSHSDHECYHQKRDGKRKESSTAYSNSKIHETFIADSTVTGCDKKQCWCNSKDENKSTESCDEFFTSPGIGLRSAVYHIPLSQQADIFNFW